MSRKKLALASDRCGMEGMAEYMGDGNPLGTKDRGRVQSFEVPIAPLAFFRYKLPVLLFESHA